MTFKMTTLAKKVCEKFIFSITYIPLKRAKYDPVNRHIIEFSDSENDFFDFDEPGKYCCKILASYNLTTPNYARLKIVKITGAAQH